MQRFSTEVLRKKLFPKTHRGKEVLTDKHVLRGTEVSFYLKPVCFRLTVEIQEMGYASFKACVVPNLFWANLSLIMFGSGVLSASTLYMYTKPKMYNSENRPG